MSQNIPLTRQKTAIVDDADYAALTRFKWFFHSAGYAARVVRSGIKPKQVFMHRVILNAPDGSYVDHINGNGLDNRRCNLRLCSQSQNICNQHKQQGRSSGYKGVSWSKGRQRWEAYIKVHGKRTHLGRFIDETDAARAYDEAAQHLHGEFAKLNFPVSQ